ncbi:MAG: N-acetylmuramoyl-L-alanine amidase [Desulfobacterium sp.]|nr:N-acetylmuramoyl-L-alanine amidase [Desulfobacterium sp.]
MKTAGPFQLPSMNTPEFLGAPQSLSATPPAATPASAFPDHTRSLIDHDILQSLSSQGDFMPFTGFEQAPLAGGTGEPPPGIEGACTDPPAESEPNSFATDPPTESEPNSLATVTAVPHPAGNIETPTFSEYLEESIWLVEKRKGTEFYSNRLQILTSAEVKNVPRSYYRFRRGGAKPPHGATPTRTIAGLLYHTSESDLFPFRPDMNQSISKYSKWLIRYTGKNRSYHYLIDRFGRVFRIVAEGDAAFHAGNAVWADRDWLYLNLNHAFLGICFEGKDSERNVSGKGGKKNRDTQNVSLPRASTLNDAQLKSGRELTDWLRVKYRIPQQNCVTHGIVSINAHNRLIGYHLDLSTGFSFQRFRLNNKNMESLPSITEFGFSYDTYFLKLFDGKLWPGIHLSEAILRKNAKAANLPLGRYREQLMENFAILFDWQRNQQKKEAQDNLPSHN